MTPAQVGGLAAVAVSPLLTRLAAERATGALLRDRGTLFLEDGRIVHAESPATPGLDVLLTTGGGGGRPPPRRGGGAGAGRPPPRPAPPAPRGGARPG
ncbi:hypothetical protein ACFV1T_24220, partial [Streptomyces vinaceus]